MSRRHEEAEHYHDRSVDAWVVSILQGVSSGEQEAVEEALEFLERDPYFFRSGYARERVARRLASIDLTAEQRVARLAVYLWSREWEAELRNLLPHHGPNRAAAKRILSAVKRQPDP